MQTFQLFFQHHPNLVYQSVAAGMFLSSLFPISLFFYGDYVYIPAALLAQSGYIDIWFVYVITVVCVVTGDTVSYFIGRWLGKHIFIKGHRFFNPKLLHKGERFFEKHGKKAILFSKLIPAVPTVASMLAGANRMNTAIFILFDLISAVVTFFLFYTVWYLGTDVIFAALQSIVALFPFGL